MRNEIRTHPTLRPTARTLLVAAATLLLLAGAVAWAQPARGARADAPRRQAQDVQAPYMQGPYMQGPYMQGPYMQGPYMQGPCMQGPFTYGPRTRTMRGGPYDARRFGGSAPAIPGLVGLRNLPAGTEVTVSVFDLDAMDPAEPVATRSLIAGQDSESAFFAELADALDEADVLRVEIGERVRTIEPWWNDDVGFDPRMRTPLLGLGMPCFACLEDGQTLTVDLYAADEAEAYDTLTFTQGVDSRIGFTDAVRAAVLEADHLELTLPATERIVSLSDDGGATFGRRGGRMGGRW